MREMSLQEQLEIAEEILETDGEYESKIQDVLNEIKSIKARKKELDEEFSNRNRKWSVGDIIWTIITVPIFLAGSVGVIAIPGGLFAGGGFYFWNALKGGENAMESLFFSILFCVMGIAVVGLLLWLLIRNIREHKKEKEHTLNLQKEYQTLCDKMPQMIADLEKKIRNINAERQKYLEENRHYLMFLPKTYRKHVPVEFMLECVSDRRADTLKEVINLWEDELRYNAALRAAQQRAEEEQYYCEALLREAQRQADELERIRVQQELDRMNNRS